MHSRKWHIQNLPLKFCLADIGCCDDDPAYQSSVGTCTWTLMSDPLLSGGLICPAGT
jgi:hypothetical protein